ncbi:DUF4097 family beta strand repeat-containing protein [Porcipelethomonas sp.]|uniref:DUF4097 family beta strand repeat-containing protein n=1 Tax=Porcipelethomonas sp. TaxID=2981675 RepID=UPI003EF75BB1
MKLHKKIKRIIPFTLLAAGIIIAAAGLVSGAKNDYIQKMNLTEFEANVPSNNIFNMDIKSEIAELNIICSNDIDDFKIKAQNISKEFLDYSTNSNTFSLRYETDKWYQTVFTPGFIHKKGKIDIYVPAELNLKDVQINSSYCTSKISFITAERIFIECGHGGSQITNLTSDYTQINNSGGDLIGLNIDAASADLNLRSGKTLFNNFMSESVIINNKFGDLDLSGKINGDCGIKSGSGDVDMTLYGNESDYKFNVINGTVSVNGKENPENNDGRYNFKINDGSGNIKIEIK